MADQIPATQQGGKSSDSDAGWIVLSGLGFLAFLILAVWGASNFVKALPVLISILIALTAVITAASAVFCVASFITGRRTGDWTILAVSAYTLAVCLAIALVIWLLSTVPLAPPGYSETILALQQFSLKDPDWLQKVLDIGLGEGTALVSLNLRFISRQASAMIPLFLLVASVIYLHIQVVRAMVSRKAVQFFVYILMLQPLFFIWSAYWVGGFG